MENEARERIKRNTKGGKVWNYQSSITDTDRLLGEAGMERRHVEQKRQRRMEQARHVERQRKPKSRDGAR